MKRIKSIHVTAYEKTNEVAQELLRILGLEPEVESTEPYRIIIENIEGETEGYRKGIDYLTTNAYEFKEFELRKYTKSEVNSSRFFDVRLYYPWELDINDAKENGTLYDNRNMCPECRRGEYQVTELVLNINKMSKRDIVYNYPDILVSSSAKSLIEENELLGCEFREVIDVKRKNEFKVYQLVITNTLPRMRTEKMNVSRFQYCDTCTRGAVIRSDIVYDSTYLDHAKDFNHSYEFYGHGAYSTPRLIVSTKVREVFTKNKIKVVAYEPITLI